MDSLELRAMIKRHEGFRDRVYMDTTGNLTCGYGHALIPGSYFPKDVAEKLFEHDLAVAMLDYRTLNLDLDTTRQCVIIDMLYNMGLPRFLGFKKLIEALRNKDYKEAKAQMIDSKWYHQVGKRGVELANLMYSEGEENGD